MNRFFVGIVALMLLVACNRNSPDNTIEPSLGKEYYPIKVGSMWEYTVDSIAYDDNGSTQAIDTFAYEYKEQVTDKFIDDLGNETFLISRWFRANDTLNWEQSRNFTTRLIDNRVERVEEDVRLVKLLFPLKSRNSWNGNMYNNRDFQSFRVVSFKVPYVFNTTTYNSVVIEESNIVNFIEEITRYAHYAEGVGLVQLKYDSLNTQSTGTKGFRYKLTLKSYQP